jgi:membrane-associated phospholipid phosphatase
MIRKIRTGINKSVAALALLSVELIIVLVIFFAALILFILIARNVFLSNKTEIDNKVFDFVSFFVSDVHTDIMQFFSFLGSHYFLIPANLLLIAYFLFIKKHKWYSIKIPVISLTTTGMLFFMKQLFNRPRPLIPLLKEVKGLSFPSGHAMISFTFYGLLIYIVWQTVSKTWVKWTLSILLILVIFMIGFSRIYLRVHYATDVLAGFCVGLVWLVIAIWVLKQIEKYSRRKINPVVKQEPVFSDMPSS